MSVGGLEDGEPLLKIGTSDRLVIRVQVWVAGGDMRQFRRYLRQKLKEGLQAANIEMPNPALDVRLRELDAA